ncbi:MAG: 4-hydroxybenzoate octaprenyltransferase [Pseudomonadota bacterium]
MQDATLTDEDRKVADALKNSWVYHLPKRLWAYAQLARWERPIGWQLLMWPCWWSATLALDVHMRESQGSAAMMTALFEFLPLFVLQLLLFTLGAIAMRGAGCTYNDLVDQDIDRKVARTRSRPLPSGRADVRHAWLFLVLQSLVGLGVLIALSQSHIFTFWLGVASLVTVAIYPFMKRITWWPQLFLGLAFSWGALMGWSVMFGEISITSICLYLGSICWVIAYDTIYAFQDIEDDALVGVKSTARLFEGNTRIALTGFYAAALLLWAAALFTAGAGLLAFLGLVAVAAHLTWQVTSFETGQPEKCLKLFKSNNILGMLFFTALALSVLF